jgi:hypothetical protein
VAEQAVIIKTKIRAFIRLMAALGCAKAEIVVGRSANRIDLTINNNKSLFLLLKSTLNFGSVTLHVKGRYSISGLQGKTKMISIRVMP